MPLTMLAIVAVILAPGLVLSMPQATTAEGEDSSGGLNPGKCAIPQYVEMLDQIDACEKAQEYEYLSDLLLSLEFTKPQLRRALCATVWGKVRDYQYYSIIMLLLKSLLYSWTVSWIVAHSALMRSACVWCNRTWTTFTLSNCSTRPRFLVGS